MHSIRESERENTDELVLETLKVKMIVDLTPSDLDRTHCIGQEKTWSNKQRAVIIKFVSYNTRKRIFFNNKLLKGTQVSITESLAAKRMRIFKETRGKHQYHSVWTADGKILYKDGHDNKVKLYYN